MNNRLAPKDRKSQLLDVAVDLAAKHGWSHITRAQIATEAGVSPALVSHSLGTMDDMRRSVMRQAVARSILPVIAQGLVARDKFALKAPSELRVRALQSLSGLPQPIQRATETPTKAIPATPFTGL